MDSVHAAAAMSLVQLFLYACNYRMTFHSILMALCHHLPGIIAARILVVVQSWLNHVLKFYFPSQSIC